MGQVSRGELATRPATRSVSTAFHRLLAEIGHRLDEAGDIVPVRR